MSSVIILIATFNLSKSTFTNSCIKKNIKWYQHSFILLYASLVGTAALLKASVNKIPGLDWKFYAMKDTQTRGQHN